MIFKAIAAMSLNGVIGKNNALPWHISEELQWFRQKTLHQTLLMGRKTFESMGKRVLPQRTTYILTHTQAEYPNVRIIHRVEDLPESLDTVWICGGANIYQQFLPKCSELFLSVIYEKIEGDAFFPEFKHLFVQQEVLKQTKQFEVQYWIRCHNL